MPGIFGWIELGDERRGGVLDDPVLAEMSRCLEHTERLKIDRCVDRGGRWAIGRIYQRDHPQRAWPWQPGSSSLGARVFVEGRWEQAAACPQTGDDRNARTKDSDFGLLSEVDGSFAALLVPADGGGPPVLAVDPSGSRPLFYAQGRSTLFFAPEVKALLNCPGVRKELDPGAAGIFLASGFLFSEQSLFAGIRRLPGGCRLVIARGEARLQRYFELELGASNSDTTEELVQHLAEEIRSSVAKDYEAEDPSRVMIFLSGGADSRAIFGAAFESLSDPSQVRTVSWAASGSWSRNGSDADIARALARRFELDHRLYERSVEDYGSEATRSTYLTDARTDLGVFHPHELELMHRLRREGFTRVLRGDECFGFRTRVFDHREALLEVDYRSLRDPPLLRSVVRPEALSDWTEASEEALGAVIDSYRHLDPTDAKDQAYFEHRLQAYLHVSAYFKELVLEHRAPLIRRSILALVSRVPTAQRIDKRLYLLAAQRLLPEAWQIPLATQHNLEDFGALLAEPGPVRDWARGHLEDDRSAIWRLLDRDRLEELLDRRANVPSAAVRRRKRGRRAASRLLAAVPRLRSKIRGSYRRRSIRVEDVVLRALTLKVWMDLFLEGNGRPDELETYVERFRSPPRSQR
ncbi:MAG TPA: asparagine synthase-related protein, partial [Thermoanaerobaculia bacterium]|nr:asparagine synthase-related protein [Thermoanaerobaculia bacterium]